MNIKYIKSRGKMIALLLIPLAFLFIMPSPTAAVVGLTVGNRELNLLDGENLFYGNVGSDSARESSLMLLQNNFEDIFRINQRGDIITAGSVTATELNGTFNGRIKSSNVEPGVFGTSTSDIFSFSGNVGIGTTDPNNLLQVNDLITFTNADFRTQIGYQAGKYDLGQYNTWIGYQAGSANNATGKTNAADYNTAVGYQSLYSNTTGNGNTANGYESLRSNTTGGSNTANGHQSLFANTSGSYNIANGHQSLFANTSGSYNIANGQYSLGSNTTGTQNIAFGTEAGAYVSTWLDNTNPFNSVFIGYLTRALADGQTNQIVIGYNAIGAGSNSVVLGNDSISTTLLKGNVGIGSSTPGTKLSVGTTNTYSIDAGGKSITNLNLPIIGVDAANKNYVDTAVADIIASGSGLWNGTVGANIWAKNSGNVGIGITNPAQKLDVSGSIALNGTRLMTLPNQTNFSGSLIYGSGGAGLINSQANEGRYNTLIGINTGYSLTTGAWNTAVGSQAGQYNTTGIEWTAIGTSAGRSNVSGQSWTAIGTFAGYDNTSDHWLAVGTNAGRHNATGTQWTAIGGAAGISNVSGSNWTALGYQAAYYALGTRFTALGMFAGRNNQTGNEWLAIGTYAGKSNLAGNEWTAIGYVSAEHNSEGSGWVTLGTKAGSYLANGTTPAEFYDNSVYIGNKTRVSNNRVTNENVFGYDAIGSGSNTVTLGNSSIVSTVLNGKVGIGTTSPSTQLTIVTSDAYSINAGGRLIGNVNMPSLGTDAANKNYVDSSFSGGLNQTITVKNKNGADCTITINRGLITATTCTL